MIDEKESRVVPLAQVNVYEEEYRHFAEAVANGIPSSISAEISLPTQKVIDQAYHYLKNFDLSQIMQ